MTHALANLVSITLLIVAGLAILLYILETYR